MIDMYYMAIANQVHRGCEAKQAWNHQDQVATLKKSKRITHAESSAGDRIHGDDLWLECSFGMKLAEPEQWRSLRWKRPDLADL
jgi:hypothetical protein